MTKLEKLMAQHPEMTPFAITRIEVAKCSEPVLRAGLDAVVDLVEWFVRKTNPAVLDGLFVHTPDHDDAPVNDAALRSANSDAIADARGRVSTDPNSPDLYAHLPQSAAPVSPSFGEPASDTYDPTPGQPGSVRTSDLPNG
jgi:hypothetical protein